MAPCKGQSLAALSVMLVLALVSCKEQRHDAPLRTPRTEPKAVIEFTGDTKLDPKVGLLGKFHFRNSADYGYSVISLADDGAAVWCDLPQYQYLEGGAWKTIEIMTDGPISEMHVPPKHTFDFWCCLSPFFEIDQKYSYRIVVEVLPSEPFRLNLKAMRAANAGLITK